MSAIKFVALPVDAARALQAGGADFNGQQPERRVSDGQGVPCRLTLRPVPAGEPYLILSYRPFPAPQPYAEVGPIFLHADSQARWPARKSAGEGRSVSVRVDPGGSGVD